VGWRELQFPQFAPLFLPKQAICVAKIEKFGSNNDISGSKQGGLVPDATSLCLGPKVYRYGKEKSRRQT
jgi:hypothetical protein